MAGRMGSQGRNGGRGHPHSFSSSPLLFSSLGSSKPTLLINHTTHNTLNIIHNNNNNNTTTPLPFSRPYCSLTHPYSKIGKEDREYFAGILEKKQIVEEEEELRELNRDWTKRYVGRSSLALFPSSTSQLSSILSYCNSRRLAVVPQGGNTGLVGGGIPVYDEIIISSRLLSSISHFDDKAGIVSCGSGVILQNLADYIAPHGFIPPLDLGAKGSCTIGGNVSTNAGGIRFLRYGSLHANVIGLEAVLADGRVIDNMSGMKKDNTGYDIKQLFIGSEGSLGFVTAVSLRCPVQPLSVQVMMIGCANYEEVIRLFQLSSHYLSDILSAYEMIDEKSMEVTLEKISGCRSPFNRSYPFYVLIETHGSNPSHDLLKVEEFFDRAEKEIKGVSEGVIATEKKKMEELWKLREGITEAISKSAPAVYKYDLSLPYSAYYSIVDHARSSLPDFFRVYAYGHVGDGNLHLNITGPDYSPNTLRYIEPWVYQFTQENKGSVSAEHGIGQLKLKYLPYSKSAACISLMQSIKRTLDPHNILNPYKVVPSYS